MFCATALHMVFYSDCMPESSLTGSVVQLKSGDFQKGERKETHSCVAISRKCVVPLDAANSFLATEFNALWFQSNVPLRNTLEVLKFATQGAWQVKSPSISLSRCICICGDVCLSEVSVVMRNILASFNIPACAQKRTRCNPEERQAGGHARTELRMQFVKNRTL